MEKKLDYSQTLLLELIKSLSLSLLIISHAQFLRRNEKSLLLKFLEYAIIYNMNSLIIR